MLGLGLVLQRCLKSSYHFGLEHNLTLIVYCTCTQFPKHGVNELFGGVGRGSCLCREQAFCSPFRSSKPRVSLYAGIPSSPGPKPVLHAGRDKVWHVNMRVVRAPNINIYSKTDHGKGSNFKLNAVCNRPIHVCGGSTRGLYMVDVSYCCS